MTASIRRAAACPRLVLVVAALALLPGRDLEAGEALSPALTIVCSAGSVPTAPIVAAVSLAATAQSAAGGEPIRPFAAAYSPEVTVGTVAGATPASPLHMTFSRAFTVNNPIDVAGVPPPEGAGPTLRYALSPGFPNPFRSVTVVRFELPEPAHVRVQIFDVMGRLVREILRDVELPAGRHTAAWDGLDNGGLPVSDGRYYCVLKAGRFLESRSLLLVK